MGDAVIVAVPVIGIVVFAMMLVIRGSRQDRMRKETDRALWKAASEPVEGGVMVYLYRDVQGSRVGRQNFRFVSTAHRPTFAWEEDLLQAKSDAAVEAAHLNVS